MIRKTLILIFMSLSFSTVLFAAGLSSAYESTKAAIGDVLTEPETATAGKCPIYADTPFEDVERPRWELMVRGNLLDFPTGGDPAFHTDNWDFGLIHNLSSQLFAYVWAGNRSTVKNEYEGSAYTTEFESQMLFAGVGFYFTPIFKVFAGGGQVVASDKDGKEPSYGTASEKGAAIDIPVMGYKIELSYRFIEATEEDIPVEEITGEGTFSSVALSLVIPL